MPSLPKKIKPCPIHQVIIELRFDETPLPSEAIFGVLYNEFKNDFTSQPISLPILQIPESIRLQDPNFTYKPHYKLVNNDLSMHIGPHVLSFIIEGEYWGWEKFSEKIKKYFLNAKNKDVITKVKRLGIRYINFFDFDIFNKIKLKLQIDSDPFTAEKTIIRTRMKSGKFVSNMQISNNAKLKDKSGSTIDIDTFLEKDEIDLSDIIESLLDEAHDEEKKLFFNLLTEEYKKEIVIDE